MNGALQEHGAIDQIGYQYFSQWFRTEFDALERRVLEVVANTDPLEWVTEAQVHAALGPDDRAGVSAAVAELTSRRILLVGDESGEVAYRIQGLALSMWISAQA